MAWVTYESAAAAAAGVALNGTTVAGRAVKAEVSTRDPTAERPARAPKSPRGEDARRRAVARRRRRRRWWRLAAR